MAVRARSLHMGDRLADFESDIVISMLADLLGKLTNLAVLQVRDGDQFNEWPLCGELFKKCSFQLERLSCHFQLDNDFVSFLDSQKSLYEFESMPPSAPHAYRPRTFMSCQLPPSVLKSLRAYSFLGFGHPNMGNILHDRPIAHFRASSFAYDWPNLLRDLRRTSCTLKSLKLNRMNATDLCLVTEAFPLLEYLAVVDLTVSMIVSMMQILSLTIIVRLYDRIYAGEGIFLAGASILEAFT
jgi:hypothetical protein